MGKGIGVGLGELLLGVAGLFFIACLYFAPTVLARHFEHSKIRSIFLLNLLGRWLFIPWLIALFWALRKPESAN